MSGHTPGPWMVKRHINKFELFSDDEMVAWITPSLLPEDDSNLSLIAAAPELLEALEECRFALEPYDDIKPRDWTTDRERLRRAHESARAAIAKATGGAG